MGDRLVRVEADLAVLVAPDQPDRQATAQLAARGLVADAAVQASAQDVELGLAHRALQPQHQAIVEHARVIDAILVGQQRAGQPTQVEQPVPISIVACQARDLKPQDDPDVAEGDLGGQVGEADALDDAAGGATKIFVDHLHLRRRPAERVGPGDELVLAGRGLRVALELGRARLADVDHGRALALGGADPGVLHQGRPPRPSTRSATATGSSHEGQSPPGPTRWQNTPHSGQRWVPR